MRAVCKGARLESVSFGFLKQRSASIKSGVVWFGLETRNTVDTHSLRDAGFAA